MNLVITDYETTGLDPDIHEIIDIGVVICDADTLKILGEYETKVRPEHIETAEPIAMAINGYNETDWADAISLIDAMEHYENIAANGVLVAHNVCFDYSFYRAALKKVGFKSKMNYHRLDVGSMGFPLIQPYQLSMDKIRLILGMNLEPAPHSGINGARAEYEALYRFREMAQSGKLLINNDCLLQAAA